MVILRFEQAAMPENVKIVECPRDAMQGIKTLIPTVEKIRYLQALLNCGFHTLDFGSFVSPKAIPQMADTAEVLAGLDLERTRSKLLAIVANLRGAKAAMEHPEIAYLGYPFSISENFQMRNTSKTIAQSVDILRDILALSKSNGKEVVVYISMGFGNPYGDPWSADIVSEWTARLVEMGVSILSLSDTVGTSTPEIIRHLFSELIPRHPEVEFGAHLHTHPRSWYEKMDAAYIAGCRRFDGAVQGFGGCPMAKDELTGNMPTEKMLSYFTSQQVETGVKWLAFEAAFNKATELFSAYQ
jgi:hydroxymethylglutaryl-CoA lyase